jgi:hypothetical protein
VNRKGLSSVFALILLVLIGGIFAGIYFHGKNVTPLDHGMLNYKPTPGNFSVTPSPTSNTDTSSLIWSLKYGSRIVLELNHKPQFYLNWKNYIIFGLDPGVWETQIIKYNISDGSSEVIFDSTKRDLQLRTGYPGSASVIGDSLFFSQGGLDGPSSTIQIDLNTNKVSTLIDVAGNISYFRSHYWFRDFLDRDYYFFDTKTTTLRSLFKRDLTRWLKYNDPSGEYVIGIDQADRLLVVGNSSLGGYSGNEPEGDFLYVYAISADKPETRVGLLSKEIIPKGIRLLRFCENLNKLFLSNQDSTVNYMFDLLSNQLNQSTKEAGDISHCSNIDHFNSGDNQLPKGYTLVQR